MKNIVGLLILSLFLSACSKNADVGNLPGTPKNNRPEEPSPTTPATYAELEWSLPIIAFTPTVVNTTKEQVVSLKNKGTAATAPLVLSWGDSNTPFAIKTGTNNCEGQVLQPGQSCSLTISYTPSFNGSRSNVLLGTDLIVSKALIINGTANGGASGDGTSSSKLVWILDDYGFGPTALGGNKTFDLILANVGGTTSQNLNLTLEDSGTPFTLVPGFNFCENQSLSPGANCKVRVKFNPTMVGDFTNVLKATDGLQNDTMDLAGTGIVINSQLVFNPTSYSFNQVLIGGQKTLDVKLRNNATVNSGIIVLSWANVNHYNIVSGLDQCSGQVLPGGSECTVRIRFAPTVSANDLTNVLTADDGFSSATVSFIGNGADPASNNPVAFNQNLVLAEDIFTLGNLAGMDPNGLPITYSIVGNPSKGTVVLLNTNTGEFRYTPDLNQNGADSFTFRVRNGNNDISAVATVSVNITPINDAPVAVNDSVTLAEDSVININVLGNDSDAEGNVLTVMAVTQPANGSVIINGDNTIRYTPNLNFSGPDSFTYVISDGAGGSASALVSIIVSPENDAPVSTNLTLSIDEDTVLNSQMPATDPDSSVLNYIITTPPAHGTVVITNSSTGNFTYTPNLNFHGTDSFSFKVSDGSLDSNISTISLNISSVNDLPITENAVLNVVEDTPKSLVLLANDADGDTLTYEILTEPAQGVLSGTAPNLTYTPNPNFHGMDVITFRVNDGTANSNVATVNIAVWAQNDAPVAFDGDFSINEDATTVTKVLTASDADGDVLTYVIVSQPTKGVLVLTNPNTGAYNYTPNPNENGLDTFTFKVFDGALESNVATVEINIDAVEDLPVANNMNIQTLQDQVYNGTFSYVHIEASTLNFELVTDGTNGSVVVNPTTGDFSYTPNTAYNGSDSFTYRITTAAGNSNTATVSVVVSSNNTAPVANNQSINVTEDVVFNGTLTATDDEGNTLTYSVVSQGTKGVVVINSSTGSFTYTPTLNQNGPDTFTFRVNDGLLNSNSATVAVSIAAVNDAPVADSKIINTTEDNPVAVVLSGSDVESSPLTYVIVTNPAHGVLSGTAPNLTYTPNANYFGNDSFTYKVNDGQLDSTVVAVAIAISGTNDAPVANNLSFVTNEDTVYNGNLVATDGDNDNLNYAIVAQPTKGVVTLNPTSGAFSYTPNANANGSDSFTFRVNDGTVNSNTATVSITITPVNDAPVANNQSINVNEDTLYSGTLTATDVEGSTLTYSVVGNASNGTLTINSNGTFTYRPNQDYVGADSFTFRANDGTDNSNTATVSITVVSFNNLPVANNQNITTDEDTATSGILVATDVDNDTLTYSVVANGAKGTAVITNAATGAFTYTPSLNQNGSDAFTFRVNDGKGNSNTATVSVTINPVNDAPVALADTVSTNRNTAKAIFLAGTDVENSALTYTVVSSPTKGVLSGTAPNLTYTPNLNQTGADSFTFRVNDGQLDSPLATVAITIVNSNTLPVANNSSLNTNEDTAKTGNVTATDADNDNLTYSVVANPTKGVLVLNSNGSYTYTPNLNQTGSDSFTFRANDGHGNSNTATVSITITPVNDAPVANNISVNTKERTPAAVNLTYTDVDSGSVSYTVVSNPTSGTLSGTAPNLIYTPNNNWTFCANENGTCSFSGTKLVKYGASGSVVYKVMSGGFTCSNTIFGDPAAGTAKTCSYRNLSDSFTYKVNDGTIDSNTATVSITIQNTDGWFNPSWTQRRAIHINNQEFEGHTNFPVMVKLDSSRIDYSKVKTGGADLRFADSEGNLLDYEIERWNSTGVSTVWVKIPFIGLNSVATKFYMYYGNAAATDAQNRAGVWSNGYVAVYHFEETTGFPQDSSGNNNHSVSQAGTINKNVSGKVAGGERFSSNSAVYRVNDSNSLDITNYLTMEAWVYPTSHNNDRVVVEKQDGGGNAYVLRVHDGKLKIRIKSKQLEFSNTLPLNTWSYVVGTFNTYTNNCSLMASQADGFKESTACTDNMTATTGLLRLGNDEDEDRSFPGALDEIRISNVVRSWDWTTAQHQSMTDSYLIYGSEQSQANALLKSQILVIQANGDDGEINQSGIFSNSGVETSGVLPMGQDEGGNNWSFYRFQIKNAVPTGASITNARLRLFGLGQGSNWNSNSHYLGIRGQKSSNPSQVSGNNQYPGSGGVVSTTATSSWGNPGLSWLNNDWNQSSNINGIVQELVNSYSGLTLNNYMQLWVGRGYTFSGGSTQDQEVWSEDFANSGYNQATLLIEWTE